MFIIEDPKVLYLLLLIIPFAAAFYWNMHRKRKRMGKAGEYRQIRRQIPQYSVGKQHLKFYLCMLAYALTVFCLSNPQLGTSVKKAERKGIDVMIALDISNSMNSNDIQPSRLMRAKQAVIRILDKMESDRIGLVIFAGDAYLQLPLTTDYGAAKLFISNIQTSDLSRQGTAIGSAIDLCAENFDPKYENAHNKAIIVISDGENHEDDAVSAAQNAAKKGIIVSTVGMGSTQGAPIPEYRNGQVVSYKKDLDGNVVITRINPAMLQEIAKAGKGFYVEANNISSGVETVFSKLSELDKVSFESRNISDYETRYTYFLAMAILILLLELFVFERRNPLLNRKRIFGEKSRRKRAAALPLAVSALLLGVSVIPLSAQTIPTNQGNRLYKKGHLEDAGVAYLKALQQDSNYYKAKYNLGNVQYGQKNYEQALENYAKVAEDPALGKEEKASVFHNLGNTFVQKQDYQKAVDSYIQALKNQPGRTDTRYNLAYAQQMLRQQQNQQNQNQEQKKQEQQNQDQQQQQQQQQNQDQQKDQQKQDQQKQQQQQDRERQKQDEQQQQLSPQQKAKRQDAERMLRALENQEKNTLDKIKKSKEKGRGVPVEKDW